MTEYKKQELLQKLERLLEWTNANPIEDGYSHMICEILYSVVNDIRAEGGE